MIEQLGKVELNRGQIGGTVHLESLWACLLDPTLDAVVVTAAERKPLRQVADPFFNIFSVVQTKLLLLEEIVMDTCPSLGLPQPGYELSSEPKSPFRQSLKPEIVPCVRLCAFLSRMTIPKETSEDETQVR